MGRQILWERYRRSYVCTYQRRSVSARDDSDFKWDVNGLQRAPVTRNMAPVILNGAPVTQNGAPMIFKRAPVTHNGSPMIFNGAPLTQNGAPVTQNGAPVILNGAPKCSELKPVVVNGTTVIFDRVPDYLERLCERL